ncbi:MAG: guanylate kinase [Clostridia bacterium]|nr:guanylate kinase [Clostridia bacterium]
MTKGVLFIMSGPSGTGKGTICQELLKTEDIYLSISSTTREIRKGEVDGVTYNYTSVEEFEKMIENSQMLEYAKYGENYYGTPRKTVEDKLNAGKNVLLEIEAQGAMQVKKLIPDAVLIFIIPPSMAELKKRLTDRGREDEDQIRQRLDTAKWEFTQAPMYTKVMVNDDLMRCVGEVSDFIKSKTEERQALDILLNEQY